MFSNRILWDDKKTDFLLKESEIGPVNTRLDLSLDEVGTVASFFTKESESRDVRGYTHETVRTRVAAFFVPKKAIAVIENTRSTLLC